jgi:hypothetical protein
MVWVKAFGILVEAQGEGAAQSAARSGHPVIGESGERKGKTLPLINTDDTDQEWGGKVKVYANLRPSARRTRVDGARLECLGMTSVKSFGILVGARGEGCGSPVQTGQVPDKTDRAHI